MPFELNRREWLAGIAGGLAALPASPATPAIVLCAFSKHFHWADVATASRHVAELGYAGMDLTVRPGGHVLPESVEDELPKAAEEVKRAGLQFPMITTAIADAGTPHAERILKTASALGIRRYRWEGFRYDLKRSLLAQIAEFRARVKELAALNAQYGMCAMYHTHSGLGRLGASQWDLHMLLEGFDPNHVSVNYDVAHATIEGGFGGWAHSARLLLPVMRGVAIKDFLWGKNDKGAWAPRWRPVGEGMVNFREFLALLKSSGFSGPLQLHMEYAELGGAETGRKELTLPQDTVLAIMRREMQTLRGLLQAAGIA